MPEDAKRASTESSDNASSTSKLRNAANAAPGEKVASLESADESDPGRSVGTYVRLRKYLRSLWSLRPYVRSHW